LIDEEEDRPNDRRDLYRSAEDAGVEHCVAPAAQMGHARRPRATEAIARYAPTQFTYGLAIRHQIKNRR
jgi:hypothetical protein